MLGRVSIFCSIFLFFALIAGFLFSPQGFAPSAFAQTSNVSINISIGSFGDLSFGVSNYTVSISPGSVSVPINVSITNTGSTNISRIYAYTDTIAVESQNPLGRGRASLYAGTGLVFMRNASFGVERAFHIGRLEWNLTANLPGENLNLGTDVNRSFGRGWYRNGSNLFLWKVENGTRSNQTMTPNPGGKDHGACNITGTIFSIKRDPENDTSGFMRDFTTGTIDSGSMDAQTKDWGIFSMSAGALNGYCVATYHNCTKVFIYRFDRRTNTDLNFNACTIATDLTTATLYPDQSFLTNLFTAVPDGLPAGETALTRITIAAS